jgi:hypothetical protein
MKQATGNRSRRTSGTVLGAAAAALLFAASIIQPAVANGAHGSGGGRGFHGGGFHRFGQFHGGFGIGAIYAPYWWGYGYPYPYYGYFGNYPDHKDYGYDPGSSYYGNYPSYDPGSSYYGNHPGYGSQPSARQTWYYCSDPAGYYPYVTQCKTGWLPVPAS